MSIIEGPRKCLAPEGYSGGGNIVMPRMALVASQIVAMGGKALGLPREMKIGNIALIDDDPPNTRALSRSLSRMCRDFKIPSGVIAAPESGQIIAPVDDQIKIFTANTAAQIICLVENARSAGINMVFTDFNMVGINGKKVTEDLRNEQKYQGCIIGLTGKGENIKDFYDSGANLVFIKPYDFTEIQKLFIAASAG